MVKLLPVAEKIRVRFPLGTPNKGMEIYQLVKRLLIHPIYFVELTFVGIPFFFSQVLVFGIAYITYQLILSGGVGSFSFTSQTIAEYFDFNVWFLFAPIGAAIVIKLASLVLKRDIVLTWRHWFWTFGAIDTFFYGLVLVFLADQGVFQATNGSIGIGVILGLYATTILFTFLHFYLYERIGRKVI